jgi:hypothetical protein
MSNVETPVPEEVADPITVFRFFRADILTAVEQGRLREYVEECAALFVEDSLFFLEAEIEAGRLP